MNELVKIEGLTKSYDGFTLDEITLKVDAGEVVGLVGANGAGKTTLIKALLGLIDPDKGTASIFGCTLNGKDAHIDAVKRRIGVVLDTCAFLTTLRICDVASLGRASYPNWNAVQFTDLCKRFGLESKRQVKDLSRGMGMKLTLAFALSHNPELLILDEATAGLDPISREEILDILRSFMEEEGHAILMASHITTDLEKIADEVVCIDSGRTLFDLSKEAICDEAGIVRCRTAELEKVVASDIVSDSGAKGFKIMKRGLGIDMLVPDRFAFAAAFPDMVCERISIEDYMTLVLKGESL